MRKLRILLREFAALLCVLSMSSAGLAAPGQDQQQQDDQQQAPDQPLRSPDQLDYLVTPIALYADPLIAQILAASTHPLEVVQGSSWPEFLPSEEKNTRPQKAAATQGFEAPTR
jgi:hypothetical protein